MIRLRAYRGVALIELVIMITIFAVASVGIMSAFRVNITGAAANAVNTNATRIAQERLEIILAQRRVAGFAAFLDPCTGAPAVCGALPAGYAVTTPTVAAAVGNTRTITVEVTHNGNPRARLVTQVTNY